ncbi:MAG: HD domain-containing protein, partial [Planctomycetes bacterium]|nr:HD domain-containing protein [Planctomycetota bacterium]
DALRAGLLLLKAYGGCADTIGEVQMLLVSISRLVPGMVTAGPVLHPKHSPTHLVERDVALTETLIHRMIEMKVFRVWVKHPLLASLDAVVLSKVPQQRLAIYETVKLGFDELQSRAITTEDYRRYCGVISALVTELLGKGRPSGELAERLFDGGEPLSGHCANVAYLAITVGMHLEDYIVQERRKKAFATAGDLTSLGVGAILHDLGKLQSVKELRDQHEMTSDRHVDYPAHTTVGFQMLRHRINPVAAAVALHHHQRWDGTGWPDMTELTHGRYVGGQSGRQTHIFARIVAAANLFDNLTARSDGKGCPAIGGLHAMQSQRFAKRFDPVILDAFLRYLPPFPTGMEVILNDGHVAAVTEINPDQPCRPKVRVLDVDCDSWDIDLTLTPGLFIQQSDGLDVTRWLYKLPPRHKALDAARLAMIV